MSASLFFILLSTVYFSHNCNPKARDVFGFLCLVLAGVAMYLGK